MFRQARSYYKASKPLKGKILIIDCHAHVSAPKAYWAYKAGLVSHRGSHGRGGLRLYRVEVPIVPGETTSFEVREDDILPVEGGYPGMP